MNTHPPLSSVLLAAGVLALASTASAQNTSSANSTATPSAPAASSATTPSYKITNAAKVGGAGGFDYVYADPASRQLYIPRGNRVEVYDLDSLKHLGTIADTTGVHGAAVDDKSGHGFCSSNPVVMWDTKTLAPVKTIPVQGRPDGILFDPATERVFVFSHSQPNASVIDAKDGSLVGTIDLGGAPEQAVSDGKGKLYVDLEDKDAIAVVDAHTLKVLNTYDISAKGGGPGGLAMDTKNGLLFAACHDPATMVILNAADGKILTALPIGAGTDGATFNQSTLEAFSSQGDGTMTVIKENSPTDFTVEQNVETKRGAKTLTLDPKTNQIYLITAEYGPATTPTPRTPPASTSSNTPASAPPTPASTPATSSNSTTATTPATTPTATSSNTTLAATPTPPPAPPARGRGRGRAPMLPDSFTILVVSKS